MFCHLKYRLDKEFYRNYFFDNMDRAETHKQYGKELDYWIKLFRSEEVTDKVVEELNLNGLNVYPRFSYQKKNTLLPKHIDEERIVGINLNLLDVKPVIHLYDEPYEYEAAMIDVGAIPHSVEPFEHDRLVLKLAVREPWSLIYERLKEKDLLETYKEDYVSSIKTKDAFYAEIFAKNKK